MPSTKQRRDAARRHLERQLKRRQEREVSRRRFTLIASIGGTLALVIVIVVWITAVGNDNKKNTDSAAGPSATVSGSQTPTPTPTPTPSVSYPPAKGASVTFEGVTVKGAADLKGVPQVSSHSSKVAPKLLVKDLVVGTGATATPESSVTVQYVGVLYKDGKQFDSSWSRGMPIDFPLNQVVPGFTQGIGGTTGVVPMKVGGRRLMIFPASLGYGSQASGSIPAGASLVFVVDLVKISAS